MADTTTTSGWDAFGDAPLADEVLSALLDEMAAGIKRAADDPGPDPDPAAELALAQMVTDQMDMAMDAIHQGGHR